METQKQTVSPNVVLVLHVMFALFTVFYMAPTQVAMIRGHKRTWPIFWWTLFTAWTIVGWIATMIWASNKDVDKEKGII